MGGSGSGRRSGSKETTSEYLQLDVRRWHREGRLNAGNVFWWVGLEERVPFIFIRVQVERFLVAIARGYRGSAAMSTETPQAVWLEWTTCNYGGKRPWFVCPGCERRVAKLFVATQFRCRHCLDLAYESQQKCTRHRSLLRAETIRTKLGGSGCIADTFPPRPKGMHQRTYRRWYGMAERNESVYLGSFVAWLNRNTRD